ncbi:MAG TPA: PilZ domain-containing protein [Planctomycetota bacterium]|nr:PilZ domain-containing protein [Planctomycetota bacterium]
MNGRQMRSTVRLKTRNNSGSVVLRRLNTPVIMCDLQDISEMGCRCVARVRINDWSDAEKWRRLLCTGELFEAEITYDPYIPFIRLPIEIRSSIALPANGYELGLAFFDLELDHRQMLNKAMIAIATEKIRESKGVLKRDSQPEVPEMPAQPLEPIQPAQPPRPELSPAARARYAASKMPPPKVQRPSDYLSAPAQRVPQETESPAQLESVPSEEPAQPVKAMNTADYDPNTIVPLPDHIKKGDPKLGEVLNKTGQLTHPQLASAVFASREKGEKLGEYLIREGVLTPQQILQARSMQTGLPYIDLDMNKIPVELLDLFPFSKMKRLEFVPFEANVQTVRIASANPISRVELDELTRICGKRIELFLCREEIPRQFLEAVARKFDRYRRAHPRFKVSLPASFQCCTPEGPLLTDATFRGRTIDISEGGLQVAGPVIIGLDPDNLAPGHLKMMVTVGAVPEDIIGICDTRHIRYVRNSGGGTTCVYGLKLDQMSAQHRDILQGLIARVTRAQGESGEVGQATPYDDAN